jgi:hypothetical protein
MRDLYCIRRWERLEIESAYYVNVEVKKRNEGRRFFTALRDSNALLLYNTF